MKRKRCAVPHCKVWMRMPWLPESAVEEFFAGVNAHRMAAIARGARESRFILPRRISPLTREEQHAQQP